MGVRCHEMIDSQRGVQHQVGFYHLVSNKREWNNCNQEILLDVADFTLQEPAEDNLMVTISQAWYNGSTYTVAAKLVKSLEMHYRMIQFLIR